MFDVTCSSEILAIFPGVMKTTNVNHSVGIFNGVGISLWVYVTNCGGGWYTIAVLCHPMQ